MGMEGKGWNILDTILLSLQLLEQILNVYLLEGKINLWILRLLTIIRILRVARLVRSLHLFDELRVIVSSIASSTSTLCWSLLLLLMMIYIFSLLFIQIILGYDDTPHHEDIHYWFSGLFRTILTMFECIV